MQPQPLIVKLDEDLSPLVASALDGRGYDVRTVRGQGWSGLRDPALFPRVVAEGAFFVTADKGFGDVRAFPPGTHPGVLVLRAAKESVLEYRDLLAAAAEEMRLEELRGAVAVISATGLRVRRPPAAE
jgi:predicted nuclease of predicted toxin-antitoxin system